MVVEDLFKMGDGAPRIHELMLSSYSALQSWEESGGVGDERKVKRWKVGSQFGVDFGKLQSSSIFT